MGVRGQSYLLADLPSASGPGIHFTGGWVKIGTVKDGAENLAPTGIWARNPPPQPVESRNNNYAIPAA